MAGLAPQAAPTLRLNVDVQAAPFAEVLTFSFPAVEGKMTTLALDWGTVRVAVTIVGHSVPGGAPCAREPGGAAHQR